MAENVEVKKNMNETNISLLRRFSRRVQSSSVLPTARANRFYERGLSRLKRKQQTLKRLERQKVRRRLEKLGKLKPEVKGRRR